MHLQETDAISVAGVDGTTEGWIAAIASGGRTSVESFKSVSALIARGLGLILIDIPIALPDAPSRRCDSEARRLIGVRRSSVFPAPLRSMLTAPDYLTACAISEASVGKACSKQLFAIMPKIRAVDDLMTPSLQSRLREGHPEVSFTMMNGGRPMDEHKSELKGLDQRRDLLRREFSDLDAQLSTVKSALFGDAIDAYALLWSAIRLSRGSATVIPVTPEFDARGIRAEVVS